MGRFQLELIYLYFLIMYETVRGNMRTWTFIAQGNRSVPPSV